MTSPYAMRVTFLPEAPSCQYSHQKISLTLREALPVADGNGEYLPSNANTMFSETNGDVTWIAWKMKSPDDALNCCSKDTGSVVHVYGNEDVVFAETRGGHAFRSRPNPPRTGCDRARFSGKSVRCIQAGFFEHQLVTFKDGQSSLLASIDNIRVNILPKDMGTVFELRARETQGQLLGIRA